MEELIQGGATVVMVSHSLPTIEKYCDRVIWLDKGNIKAIGAAQDVISKYVA